MYVLCVVEPVIEPKIGDSSVVPPGQGPRLSLANFRNLNLEFALLCRVHGRHQGTGNSQSTPSFDGSAVDTTSLG